MISMQLWGIEMYEVYARLRDEKGVRDATIAKATGIGRSTFSDWKNGRSTPKDEKLQKIADYLGVSAYYLRTGKEPIMIEIDPQPHRNMMGNILENTAPGLSFVCDTYIALNEDDREEIIALMKAKLKKYDMMVKKDANGSA